MLILTELHANQENNVTLALCDITGNVSLKFLINETY